MRRNTAPWTVRSGINAAKLFWLWLIFSSIWIVLAPCNGPLDWRTVIGVPATFGLLAYVASRTIFVGYSVGLAGRNEGVKYADRNGVYLFGCRLNGTTWVVSLPPTDPNKDYQDHPLSPEEEVQILARVASYLSRIRSGSSFKHEVEFERDELR